MRLANRLADIRAAWMQRFEEKVVELAPQHRGKIDWETAKHFYFTGLAEGEAAVKYVASRSQP